MAKRVGLFADISNLYYCVFKRFGGKIDYHSYLSSAVGQHELFRAYAYGAQMNTEANDFLECLKAYGYHLRYKKPKEFENPEYRINIDALEEVMYKANLQVYDRDLVATARKTMGELRRVLKAKKDTRKADWDVGLAIDVVRVIDRIDIAIIGSADGDLAPLVEWVKDRGCRSVVYACNISRELKEVADEVIEIEEDVLEGRNQ